MTDKKQMLEDIKTAWIAQKYVHSMGIPNTLQGIIRKAIAMDLDFQDDYVFSKWSFTTENKLKDVLEIYYSPLNQALEENE